MSVTKAVTQGNAEFAPAALAHRPSGACGWVFRRELWPHALRMTVREVRHMTRQLPEVPDKAACCADEQNRGGQYSSPRFMQMCCVVGRTFLSSSLGPQAPFLST